MGQVVGLPHRFLAPDHPAEAGTEALRKLP